MVKSIKTRGEGGRGGRRDTDATSTGTGTDTDTDTTIRSEEMLVLLFECGETQLVVEWEKRRWYRNWLGRV